jgi:uncharacterized protein
MPISRRQFMQSSSALAAFKTLGPHSSLAALAAAPAASAIDAGRMAYSPATWIRPYVSRTAHSPSAVTWLQIDLGSPRLIDGLRLYPAFNPNSGLGAGYGFPLRFKIESADDPSFASPHLLVDCTASDFANPESHITQFSIPPVSARYVRLTATQLRPARDGIGYALALSKIDILSADPNSSGQDLAARCPVTGDAAYANPNDLQQVTRPARPMGEGIVTDNPSNVTPSAGWRTVPYGAATPLSGVTLQSGLFHHAMENNITYLLTSFSVDEMLRPFRERAGKPVAAGLRNPIAFWDTDLPGSSAGRFLMGAGNILRWREHAQLRAWLNALVDGIAECRQPNGYIMAYPEDKILYSEKGGYTRSWLTQGLIEAGYAGNPKAFPLLRGFYDWFDQCSWLPQMLRGGTQGVQGMIANTRMYFTPVGKPADIEVIQRFYQENYWLDGLARRDTNLVWQYPYDRPHNYLITDFEAYLDIYRATGDRRYLDAMLGAWQLYHDNWEHVGGSIAITEFGEFPPKSYRLAAQMPFCETGENCGSAFWIRFNQRLQLLHPEEERYANEIEKSIYNVILANQVGSHGIIYHARLVGMRGDLPVPLCTNSCCEGQGTRIFGSLPEYIFSTAPDGLYVNLFAPAVIAWQQSGTQMNTILSSDFPKNPDVKLEIWAARPTAAKIRIRIPAWAAAPMPIRVNSELAATGAPGSYVTLDRIWSSGDTIRFTLPMQLKLTRYTGLDQIPGHQRFALEYGPILLALIGSDSAVLSAPPGTSHESILNIIHPDPYRPLHFTIDGHPQFTYIPYWQVVTEPFTCFPVIDRV